MPTATQTSGWKTSTKLGGNEKPEAKTGETSKEQVRSPVWQGGPGAPALKVAETLVAQEPEFRNACKLRQEKETPKSG